MKDLEENNKEVQESKKEKENKTIKIVTFIILLLLLIILFCIVVSKDSHKSPVVKDATKIELQESVSVTPSPKFEVDKNAVKTDDAKKTDTKKSEQVKAHLIISPSVILNDGSAKSDFGIQNSKNNKGYIMVAEIKDGDHLLYKSEGIPAGYSMGNVKLNNKLSKGVYDCVCYCSFYNKDTMELIGRAGVKTKITVLH